MLSRDDALTSTLLNIQAFQGDNPYAVATEVEVWLNQQQYKIQDITFFPSQDKIAAIVVYRRL